MVNMENAEEVMQILDRFTRLKQKEIPKELDDYLQYVAKTGDTVFKWSSLKYLFREKLLNVIKNFHDTTPRVDEIPQYPNVDPFNYENMKSSLLERLELFNAAPFTIQRLCELLIDPRKQYSRIDKFMRALEKNILVVSTIEPGRKRTESENGDSLDSVVNGDLSLDVNVDIDMENEPLFNMETQNGNGNGNGTSAVTAGNAADTPPAVITSDVDGVEASPKSKTASTPGLEVPNVPHRADDDVLPNPKKAKLDLNAENDENEEKQEVDGVVVSKSVDGEEVKEDAEVAVDAVKAANNGDDGGEVAMQEDLAVEEEEKKQIEKAEEKEKVDDLKENAVEKVINDKQVEEKENEKDDNVEKQQKESEELPKKVNNEIIPEIKVQMATNNVDSSAVEEEKIIEKEELEQSEKEQKKFPEVTVKKSEQQNGNESETKESTATTTTTSEAELTNEVEGKKVVAESENKPLEKDEKSANVEKEEEEVVKEKEVEVSSSTNDKTDDVTENLVTESTVNEVNSTCVEKKTEKESVTAEATATKVDEKKKTEEAETPTATTTTPATPEESTTATTTTTEAAAASTVVTSTPPTPIEADPPLIVASIDSVTVEQISNNEVTAVVAAITETSAIVVGAVTDDITSTPTTTTTPTPTPTPTAVEAETTAITESAPATTTTTITSNEITDNTPAVTLEPMEDVLLEEVPPTVEEVVMAETSSGGATAMATDSMEPPVKDDDGGMEVDDTSQEAMDQ